MQVIMVRSLIAAMLFLVRVAGVWAIPPSTPDDPAVDAKASAAIMQAISDEIYDYSLQRNYRSVGIPTGNGVKIPVYIFAGSSSGTYYIIYKLMPFGEMYRRVDVSEGIAYLFRNPRIGFPPDSPATLSLYYSDDDICQRKQHSVKIELSVVFEPSNSEIVAVEARQRKRYGFSVADKKKQ